MQITKIQDGTWIFDEGGVRFFLLTGSERALLIDSGMMTKNAKELARDLTSLPIELLNTHADRDHTAGNGEFDFAYMSLAECSNYYHGGGKGKVIPVWDQDVIDLGGRPLRIISIPGHTPGSIAVLDEKNRRIFTGDPVQDGRIFMFGVQREMHAYVHSLERLMKFVDLFDEIYPSHGGYPLKPEVIPALKSAAEKILSGELEYKPEEVFGQKIKVYDVGIATFLTD